MIKDIKILSVIIIISAALFAYTFTFDEVPEILAQGMQPTMMPRLIFSLIIFLSIFQLIQNKKIKSDAKEMIRRNAFITFAYTLFIVLIADKLGFLISIFLYTLLMPILWQRKDYIKIFFYSLVISIFAFAFLHCLQPKFPQGIFEEFIIRNFTNGFLSNISLILNYTTFGLILGSTIVGVLRERYRICPHGNCIIIVFTIYLEPATIAAMAALYCGGTFGGSVINIDQCSRSTSCCYHLMVSMAQKGEAK